MDQLDNKKIKELSESYLIQKNQYLETEKVLTQAMNEIENLNALNQKQDDMLDQLLQQAQELCKVMGYSEEDITEEDIEQGNAMLQLTDEEQSQITIPYFGVLSTVDENGSWEDYMNSLKKYAGEHDLDLSKDPFDSLLSETEKDKIGQRIRDDYMMQKANCDKYDYMIVAFCGVISGLIDSFFVGKPGESKLGHWGDDQADKFITKLSRGLWNLDASKRNEILKLFQEKKITKQQRDRMLKEAGIPYNQNLKKKPETLQQCIQYLEKKFPVNYDASSAVGVYLNTEGQLNNMWAMNHHIISLAHSPSIIGLIFSILDQFTGKASFIDNGQLIRLVPKEKENEIDRFELRGKTFPTKLLCGFVNWIGHLCSDLVGANTTRIEGGNSRGTGLPVPFMELLQLCRFEVPDGNGERIEISKLTIKIFENGYDLRFAAATAIPVLLNEFFIRLLWALKSRFYHKRNWKDSMPFGNKPELRRMLLAGHGALCSVDVIDAGIRSVDLLTFALHLNVTAWMRLGISGLQEIRAIYKDNVIDVIALDQDLEREWKRLYNENIFIREESEKIIDR